MKRTILASLILATFAVYVPTQASYSPYERTDSSAEGSSSQKGVMATLIENIKKVLEEQSQQREASQPKSWQKTEREKTLAQQREREAFLEARRKEFEEQKTKSQQGDWLRKILGLNT